MLRLSNRTNSILNTHCKFYLPYFCLPFLPLSFLSSPFLFLTFGYLWLTFLSLLRLTAPYCQGEYILLAYCTLLYLPGPYLALLGTAPLKLRKTESSRLKEIPLQMLPMGMWGPENMKIKKFRWGLFDF